MIRQRSQGNLKDSVKDDTYFHQLECVNEPLDRNVVEPWLLDAMEAFDAEHLSSGIPQNLNDLREKATTPSQEIVVQTKAVWNEQNRSSKTNQKPSVIGYSPVFGRKPPHSNIPVRKAADGRRRTPSNPLWSELQGSYKITPMSRSSKYSSFMSEKKQDQRQTRTFHGFSTEEQSRNSGSAKSRTNQTSQRLQAILGVENNTSQISVGRADSFTRSPGSRRFASRLPIRTSSIPPLHHRRESSVYGSGGPTTPPPLDPLPAIPTSESHASLRTSSTNPLVLHTPVSPATSLGTSATHWSWRLAPDSPGSQLLNEMKVATDMTRTRRVGDSVIPTKRHVYQRSISSSALSATILEETGNRKMLSREDTGRKNSAFREDGRKPVKGLQDSRNPPPPTKFESNVKSGGFPSALSKLSSIGLPDAADRHSGSPATSQSAGSPSSIVILYMRRPRPNLAADS